MRHFTVHRLCTSFTPGLVLAWLLCAPPMLHAAEPAGNGRDSRAAHRNDLRLQYSFSLARPIEQRTGAPSNDGTTLAEECEEYEDMTPVVSIPHTPPVKAATPATQPAPVNEPLLAKMQPASQSTESRLPAPAPQQPAPAIAAAQPPKESQSIPVPPAEPAPPATPATPAPVWEINLADKTLSVTLGRWAEKAGWQLLWELPVDYAVEAQTAVPGTFEEAVDAVTKSMEAVDAAMHAVFYKGNKVLRIVARRSE